jgi:hypothetical protein
MDGTTAGRLGFNPLIPQPAPSNGGDLTINHAAPIAPQPVPQNPIPQQQYSQLTPVYAPTPTNTPADIPQPAVKGIEFVKPSPQVPPVVSSVPAPMPTPMQTPVIPTSVAPVIPRPLTPALPVVNIPPAPAMPAPKTPQTTPLSAPSISLPPLPPTLPTSYSTIEEAESQIDNVDLDQIMGTPKEPMPVVAFAQAEPTQIKPEPAIAPVPVPAHIAEPVPATIDTAPKQPVSPIEMQSPEPVKIPEPAVVPVPVSAPAATNASEAAKYYFQNSTNKTQDIPIVINANKVQRSMIIRIAIIVVAVIILGVGGFFVWGAISSSQKQTAIPSATTTKDQGTTTNISQPSFTTPANTTTTETTTTPATTTTDPAVTTTPAVTTPVTTTPAVTTPTPVVTNTTPSVPDSGISDDYASLPKYLSIDKLSINAPIEQLGLTSSGAMGVPSNIWNAGWYIGSARPGQRGAAFIDGHSSSSRGALFGNLDTLKNGDVINVVRNDGIKVTFNVVDVKVVNRHEVDMNSMLKPYGKYARGLNIMSCVGDWIESEQTLENRVLIYAVQS